MEENFKRKIIRGVEVDSFIPMSEIGVDEKSIKRIWTILDEEKMFDPDKINPYTGEKIENPVPRTLENPYLRHGYTVFLEDKVHDWNIYDNKFKYYTRIAGKGKKCDLLIEYI